MYTSADPSSRRSKAWVCGSLLAATACWNLAGGHEALSVLCLERFQVEVSASGRSLIQRSPTVFGVQSV